MDWLQCGLIFKVYQTMFRVVKDSEHKDERQHCFIIQTCGQNSRYLSVETRQELLRIEAAWHAAVCSAVAKIGVILHRFNNLHFAFFIILPEQNIFSEMEWKAK